MDFGLSEEQELLQDTVRGYIEQECPPSRLREIFDGGVGHDVSLWGGLAEMGVTGLMISEKYGGSDLEILDAALVCEVLGYGGLPGPLMTHLLAAMAIQNDASEERRESLLPALADGTRIGSVALCERESAWSSESWRCTAKDGVLSGQKLFVPHAATSDVLVVGVEGGGLVLVEDCTRGVTLAEQDGIDRTRPIFQVDFDETPCVLLSDDPSSAGRLRDGYLALLAADAFGAASRLIDLAVEYAKTREQFGQKIGQFQAVKHQLARLGLEIEPTRSLFWWAAHALDHLPEEGERGVALAKAHITDRAMETARTVVELHGGIGFTWECDVQMWFKRVMFDRTVLGTPEILRQRCADLAGW